jgi:hypothetical protein
MSTKYTNIFHRKILQKLPKFGFLVLKYIIWQSWLLAVKNRSEAILLHALMSFFQALMSHKNGKKVFLVCHLFLNYVAAAPTD